MIKEIFDKLRRYDKMIKMKPSTNEAGGVQLPDPTMRWVHTIIQLMNYRFIRFLKFSPLSSGLLHYIRYSISYMENRQCYQVLESFAINVIVSDLLFCIQNKKIQLNRISLYSSTCKWTSNYFDH